MSSCKLFDIWRFERGNSFLVTVFGIGKLNQKQDPGDAAFFEPFI